MYPFSVLLKKSGNFLFGLLMARVILVEEMGVYSRYLNIINTLLIFSNFGFNDYILVNSTTEFSYKRKLNVSIILSFVSFLILTISFSFFENENVLIIIFLSFKLYCDTQLYNIVLTKFQWGKKMNTISFFNIFIAFLSIVFSLLSYTYFKSILGFILPNSLIYIIIMITIFWRENFFSDFDLRSISFKNSFSNIKYYGLSYITTPLYMIMPNFFASFFLNSSDMAIYQIAFTISNVSLLITIAFNHFKYSEFIHTNNLKRSLINSIIQISIYNVLVFVTFLFLGKMLLLLFYKQIEYLNSYIPALILLLSNSIFSIGGLIALVIIVSKEQKKKFHIHLEIVVLSLISSLVFILQFKIIGTAIAIFILGIYSCLRFLWVMNKKDLLNKPRITK